MDDNEKAEILAKKILKGSVPTYRISNEAGNENVAAAARRKYLEKRYSTRLIHTAINSIDLDDANNRNIENVIGATQVPVGFAEILVNGEYATKDQKRPIFLATTEGKLVAGVNRGAAAINKSGGATTRILKNGMTRSVILETKTVVDSWSATQFIKSAAGRALIAKTFSESTKYLTLQDIEVYNTGRLLFIVYSADTSAAMGMNMLTIASSKATRAVVDHLAKRRIRLSLITESGNMCVDKKPSMINVIRGRGISVIAEATIKKKVLKDYFRADAKKIDELNHAKNYVGSSLAGSTAHNAHVANILAAIFIAYGQDAAQVVDGVNALDDTKAQKNGDLYISVYIPALEVGTYGGGTRRETQRELLTATGVYGEGDSKGKTKMKFAEIIAAAVLAGELNLLAAQAGMELSSSHASLKRG
jgi:hydroxymethylglutaryl-CoA reductase (NADPH)